MAHRRREELVDQPGIRTWLYRVAVNLVRRQSRSHSRYDNVLGHYAQQQNARPAGPQAVVERAERGKLVHACVQKLSEKQREVFVLYELEELEGRDIAEILDLPLNTVWSRLRLARDAFRQIWADTVGDA